MEASSRGRFARLALVGLALSIGACGGGDSGERAAAPVFTPAAGNFTDSVEVSFSTTTAGADIYYELTSNGAEPADPTTASRQYLGPFTLARTAAPGASNQYRIKAVSVMPGMADSSIASARYTITTPAGSAYALKVTGTTDTNYGETSVNIQFNMTGPTDFTTEDYTASFDLYVPSTSTAPRAIQTQYPDDTSYKPMYFDKYAIEYDTWQTLTYELTKANRAYPSPTSDTPLNPDANKFRIAYSTEADAALVEFYVRNLRVTNGTQTPLDIPIDASTTVESLGIYRANGEGVDLEIAQR